MSAEVAALRAEIARLKGLKGPPSIKPSGMEQASDTKPAGGKGKRRRRGAKRVGVAIEDRVVAADVPPGSRFKGYQTSRMPRIADFQLLPEMGRMNGQSSPGEKISCGTRSDIGRDCRDTFLGLSKTCAKLGISFWDYLGSRPHVDGSAPVPYLSELVTQTP